jgi:hypothetical protein
VLCECRKEIIISKATQFTAIPVLQGGHSVRTTDWFGSSIFKKIRLVKNKNRSVPVKTENRAFRNNRTLTESYTKSMDPIIYTPNRKKIHQKSNTNEFNIGYKSKEEH